VTHIPSERPQSPPPGLDTGTAHSVRVWNYLLGGKDNYAADRAAGDMLAQMFPGITAMARMQRQFQIRAVRFLAEAGIRQFVQIGTGLPTSDSTHEVAQRIAPESRIVYVDNDPLVLVYARAMLISAPGGVTSYVEADARDTQEILHEAARTLDFARPVAVLMLGILGQIPDFDEPGSIVTQLLRPLASGSYLVVSDGTDTNPALSQAVAAYNERSANPYHLRSPRRIAAFFDGLTLVPPGVVPLPRWRPSVSGTGGQPRDAYSLCGAGLKN
jgi:S-adenosyl methyltransferase